MSFGIFVRAVDCVSIELLEQFDTPQQAVIYRGNNNQMDVTKKFVKDMTDITLKI